LNVRCLTVFLMGLVLSLSAASQTIWPNYISDLQPDISESPVSAQIPADALVQTPDASLPADKVRWSGEWSGWACQGRLCDLKLVVESVRSDGATIVYSIASSKAGAITQRLDAKFKTGELQGVIADGTQIALRMRTDNILEVVGNLQGKVTFGGIVSNRPRGSRVVERISTSFVENGKAVFLEMVIYKPPGIGPFPTLMFNHGSTGSGSDPSLFTSTWTSSVIAGFFNEQGWMVVFPQRRERGKSDGLCDEGFEHDRSRYACEPTLSLAGLDRATADLDAAANHLGARPDVDSKRMLIGGQSRGGVASIAYSGAHPDRFVGVLNFVGGWVGDGCRHANSINGEGFRRGAAYRGATLWLYGENDPFYKISHSRRNFDHFQAAGGNGEFHVFTLATGQSGHGLISIRPLWQSVVMRYLERLPGK
jgi:dienelactone hydrolase